MKKILMIILILGLLTLLAIILINLQVGSYSTDRIFNDIDSVPAEERVALVLGARARNGEPSDMLYDRVVTAVELYKAGKTRKLLFSGGDDEPEVMKKLAVKLEVPETDIVLDDQGLRTYDSCIRAKLAFAITSAIVVTQDFHLPRSIYLCQSLGVDSVGMNAKRRNYIAEGFGWNREYLANVAAWHDINFTALPAEPSGEPAQ
jgi:SanA protein